MNFFDVSKPKAPGKTLGGLLFLNEDIKTGRKCMLFKSQIEKRIYCIGHTIEEIGGFINIMT